MRSSYFFRAQILYTVGGTPFFPPSPVLEINLWNSFIVLFNSKGPKDLFPEVYAGGKDVSMDDG